MADWPIPDTPADEERIVRFKPAFHRCDPEPSKDYGIGSVYMVWILRVGDRAIAWDAFTGWELPDEAFKSAAPDCTHPLHQHGAPTCDAAGGVVDWHSPVPMWEGHEPQNDDCPIIGTACYTNTGYLLGNELFDLLRTDGDESVWGRMRELLEDDD